MIDSCIGLDPGPATGMCLLDYENGRLVGRTLLTTDGASAVVALKGLLMAFYGDRSGTSIVGKRIGSLEKFVTGQSAGSRGKAADVTRQLVMELAEVLQMFGYRTAIRSAGDVKPWATDKLLLAAQIPEQVVKREEFRHAADAARHCLFGAKEAGVIRNPLLEKGAALHLADGGVIRGANPQVVVQDEIPYWLRRHP